jgi:hypothetical protein
MDLWAIVSAALSSLKPSSLWLVKFDPSIVERQQWACCDILVLEPLLESDNGVRVDRGLYVVAVRFDLFALQRLCACRLGASLLLDLPGKELR